jgi:hypothetical protein
MIGKLVQELAVRKAAYFEIRIFGIFKQSQDPELLIKLRLI